MSETKELSEIANKKYLNQLSKEVEETVITKSNCKVCNSKFRAEAEALYEDKKSMRSIHKWLAEQEEEYDYKSITNHFKEHYERQKIDFMVQEYVSHMSKYRIDQVDELDRLQTRRDMFDRTLLVLLAKNDTTTFTDEIRKNATALKSLNDAIGGIDSQINEIKKEFEPIVLVLKTLQVLIGESIDSTNSEEVKSSLIELLDKFEQRVDSLFAE